MRRWYCNAMRESRSPPPFNEEPQISKDFWGFFVFLPADLFLLRWVSSTPGAFTSDFFFIVFLHRISRMNRKAILLIGLLTDFRGYLAAGQWLAPEMVSYCFCHADFADDANFFSLIILVPQISQIYTDFFSLIIFLMDLHGFSLVLFFPCHFFFFSVISLFRRF